MPPATLTAALADACQRSAERVALAADGRTLTYAELDRAVRALAARYHALGVQPRARIVCALSNGPDHLVAAGAAWACGAVHVGVHHESTDRELSTVVGLTAPDLVVCAPASGDVNVGRGPDLTERLRAHSPRTRVLRAGRWDTVDDPSALVPETGGDGTTAPSTRDGRLAYPGPDDPAAIFLTSGSTASPPAPSSGP